MPFQLNKALENLTIKRKLDEQEENDVRRVRSRMSLKEEIDKDDEKIGRKKADTRKRKGISKGNRSVVKGVQAGELFEVNIGAYLEILKGCGGWPELATRDP